MKASRLCLVLACAAAWSPAQAEESLLATVSGTTAVTYVATAGAKLGIQCDVDVRYSAGNASSVPDAGVTSAMVMTGDVYVVRLRPNNDRVSIVNAGGAGSFSCAIYSVTP
jgi:hypothetical protein